MGKKEFSYSVLASIVAAILLEISGVFEPTKYLSIKVEVPIWSMILFVVLPVVLSLIWFRKTVTPAHSKLISEYTELKDKKESIENALDESRAHSVSLDIVIASTNTEIKRLHDKLAEWEKRGIKLWQEGDEFEQIVNKTFGPEIVELDGKEFTGCKFEGSILKFKGTGPISLNHNVFGDVRWVMDKPASQAFSFLGSMYSSGMPEMQQVVEQTFENMKRNAKQKS
jgi:hypothetical protein